MMEAVRSAVTAADAPALFQAAHRLKSAVSNVYANDAVAAAARLERMGRCEQLDESEAALTALDTQVSRLLSSADEAVAGVSDDL
jgi:HPt (histidine-containing phosphotransfer) domain-containing protein